MVPGPGNSLRTIIIRRNSSPKDTKHPEDNANYKGSHHKRCRSRDIAQTFYPGAKDNQISQGTFDDLTSKVMDITQANVKPG